MPGCCCVTTDVHVLAALPWCAVVVDRRQRSRSAAGKAQLALQVRTGARLSNCSVLAGEAESMAASGMGSAALPYERLTLLAQALKLSTRQLVS